MHDGSTGTALKSDPPGCRRPVGHLHIEHCYPDKDECGGETEISGFWVEYLEPGCTRTEDWKRSPVFTAYPGYLAKIPVQRDGQYAFRTVTVSKCTESVPSEPTPVFVNLAPPAKSKPPVIVVPCPQ